MLSASQSLSSEICSLTAPSSQRHRPLISKDLVTIPHLPKASPASICPHCSAVPAPYLPSGAGALWARVPDGHVQQGQGRRLSAFEGSLQQSRVCPAPTISACAVGDRGAEEHKGPQTIGRAGSIPHTHGGRHTGFVCSRCLPPWRGQALPSVLAAPLFPRCLPGVRQAGERRRGRGLATCGGGRILMDFPSLSLGV